MMKKKICFIGSFGVGKTSLIRKYVLNIFSEAYLSTVGVKIDKKILRLDNGTELTLLLWDLESRDDFRDMAEAYLRGMSGYFLVADGTREDSFDFACRTGEDMRKIFRDVPSVLLLNKADLSDCWKLSDKTLSEARFADATVLRTSAKSGLGVEDAFLMIARKMVGTTNAAV